MLMRRFKQFLGRKKKNTKALPTTFLNVEMLENRIAPATISWISDADGTWHDERNWSGGVVPTAVDDVIIDRVADPNIAVNADIAFNSLLNRETIEFNRIVVNGRRDFVNEGAATARTGTDINVALTNRGTFVSTGTVDFGSTVDNESGGAFRMFADCFFHAGVVGVADSFSNSGEIVFDARQGGCNAQIITLDVADGKTLTNTGEIKTLGSDSPFYMILDAEVVNQGLLDLILQPLEIRQSGAQHVNTGTIDASEKDLRITQSGERPTFTNSGRIEAVGQTVFMTGGAFHLPVNTTIASSENFNLTDTDITGDAGVILTNNGGLALRRGEISVDFNNYGVANFFTSASITAGFSNAAGATTSIRSSQFFGATELDITNGFTNEGVIELLSQDSGGNVQATKLDLADGETLVNLGTIRTAGDDAPHFLILDAQIDNQGTIDLIQRPIELRQAGAQHVNTGTINADAKDFRITQTGENASFSNSGTFTAQDHTIFVTGGTFHVLADMTIDAGDVFNLTDTDITGAAEATLTNAGGLALRRGEISVDFVNQGVANFFTSASITGSFSNEAGASLGINSSSFFGDTELDITNSFTNAGTITLFATEQGNLKRATLDLAGGETLINTGLIRTAGASLANPGFMFLNAQVDNQGEIRPVERGLTINQSAAQHANSGLINATSNFLAITNATGFSTSGQVDVGDGFDLDLNTNYVQTGGTTTVVGDLDPAGTYELQGGTLSGTGRVQASVNNTGGSVNPGESVGKLDIQGSYSQGSGGELIIEIDGPPVSEESASPPNRDRLVVTGTVSLDGNLQISLLDDFTPELDDLYPEVVLGNSRTGTFATDNAAQLGASVTYSANSLDVAFDQGNSSPFVANEIADFSVEQDADDVRINLLSVFDDPDLPNDDLSFQVFVNSNPELIGAAIDGDELLLAFSDGNFGQGDVAVRATDQGGLTADDRFTITVTPPNRPPEANLDSTTTLEDFVKVIPIADLLENDSDPDGDPLRTANFSISSQPVNGTVTIVGEDVRYEPDDDFNGTDSFRYQIADGRGGISNEAFVIVSVTPQGDPFTAIGDEYFVPVNGFLSRSQFSGLLVNDIDPDNTPPQFIEVQRLTSPAGGGLGLSPFGRGAFTYSPPEDFQGTVNFFYRVETAPFTGDPSTRLSNNALVTIRVHDGIPAGAANFVKSLPSAAAEYTIAFTTEEFTNNIASDLPIRFVRFNALPSVGVLELDGTPVEAGELIPFEELDNLVYSHGVEDVFVARDLFTYQAHDGAGLGNQATVTINHLPTLTVPESDITLEDTNLQIEGLSVTDLDGENLTLTISPSNGRVRVDGGVPLTVQTLTGTPDEINAALQSVVLQPGSSYFGPAPVTFSLSDGIRSLQSTVNVEVTPVNDAPAFTVGSDISALSGTASFIPGWATSIRRGPPNSANENDQNLTFIIDSNSNPELFASGPLIDEIGNLSFTTADDAVGLATIGVRLMDDGGTDNGGVDTSEVQIFTISVNLPVVTTLLDEDDGGLGLGAGDSLREVIQAANVAPGSPEVRFEDGLTGEIQLNSQLPEIISNMVLVGPGADLLSIVGADGFRIFAIGSGANVEFFGLTITGANTPLSGAGIFNDGTLTLREVSVIGNSATGNAGGGGILSRGELFIYDSTVANNAAALDGGGIAISGLLSVFNSTLSGNSTNLSGGAIFNTGIVQLTNVTVTNNRADTDENGTGAGGGIFNITGSGVQLSLENSIVADNLGPSAEIGGSVKPKSSFSVIGADGTGGLTDGLRGNQVGVTEVGLGPLADNGGPTLTHALLADSRAIDAGADLFAENSGLTTDQRGEDRFADGGSGQPTVDVGAFEYSAQVYIVSTTSDVDDGEHGVGELSLREAILLANASQGRDVIRFEISGGGVQTIQPLSQLPTITDAIVIDGYSQPGASEADDTNDAVLMIEVKGNLAPAGTNGLTITGGNSIIRGLVVNRFSHEIVNNQAIGGRGIVLSDLGGNIVEGNFIATDASGTALQSNSREGVSIVSGDGNLIGGNTPAARNVIAGNRGIVISGGDGQLVQGNHVGIDVTGSNPLGANSTAPHISISGGQNHVIGGDGPGEGNVIGIGIGIRISSSNNLVQGNIIGLDATGTTGFDVTYQVGGFQLDVPPSVEIIGGNQNMIGGTSVGARNILRRVVVSSNQNQVYGNYIGTDITGTNRIESYDLETGSREGVLVAGSNNQIGGPGEGEGNLISGHSRSVEVFNVNAALTGNVIAGNHIGTNADGSAALPNLTGIFSVEPNTTIVGNLVSGNLGTAIVLFESDHTVQSNWIGTDSTGEAPLGNGGPGISVIGGNRRDNTIGGELAGNGNVIAFNGGPGIQLAADSGLSNSILGNSIFSNTGPGIDLGADGPTANDETDDDTGVNNLQNFPEFFGDVKFENDELTFVYRIPSEPTQSSYPFRVEFFIADADVEEGQTFIGSVIYREPDANKGGRLITLPIPTGATSIVATATDDEGNTSEFSAALPVATNIVTPPPTINPIFNVTVNEDSGNRTVLFSGISPGAGDNGQFVRLTFESNNPDLFDSSPNQAVPFGNAYQFVFRPAPDANGAAVVTVNATDNGLIPQTTTRQFTITVNPVNDRPILDDSGIYQLDPVFVNQTDSPGIRIVDLLASVAPLDPITDVDVEAVEGIAITGGSVGNGSVQYSLDDGTTWQSAGPFSVGGGPFGGSGNAQPRARLLAADANTRVRFVPAPNFIGTASFTFVAWDQSLGGNGETVDPEDIDTSLSTDSDTVSVEVIDTRPTLDNSGNTRFEGIEQNEFDSNGTSIVDLLASVAPLDPISSPTTELEGIAVTSKDTLNGQWQFSLDNGQNWQDIGTLAGTFFSGPRVQLLAADADTRLRFVPDPGFIGTSSLEFKAWNQLNGTNGELVGPSSVFQSTSDAVEEAVIAVGLVGDDDNSRPVLQAFEFEFTNEQETVFTQFPGGPGFQTEAFAFYETSIVDLLASGTPTDAITDADIGAEEGIAITATRRPTENGQPVGSWQYTINDGTSWHNITFFCPPPAVGQSEPEICTDDFSRYFLLAAEDDTLVRFVLPVDANPSLGLAALAFRAWDQSSGASGGYADIEGLEVFNSISLEGGFYADDFRPILRSSSVNISGLSGYSDDNGVLISRIMDSVRVDIADPDIEPGIGVRILDEANGVWEFSLDAGENWAAVGPLTGTGGSAFFVRQLAPDDQTRIRFVPNEGFKGSATFRFHAWDQTMADNGERLGFFSAGSSVSQTNALASVTVPNAAPELDTSGDVMFNPIFAGVPFNSGTSVVDLLNSAAPVDVIFDINGDPEGIAISAIDESNGIWQYTLNSGATWFNVGPLETGGFLSSPALRLLSADGQTFVRILPDEDFVGSASIQFRAWDQSAFDSGDLVTLNALGSSTNPFFTENATINVVEANDEDDDGVGDDVEAGAPNNGDGNNDGVPDNDQANVSSLPNPVDGKFVTIAAPSGTRLQAVEIVENPSDDPLPGGQEFPIGFVQFALAVDQPGDSTTVTLHLEDGTRVTSYYKYGPTPENRRDHFYNFTFDGRTGAQFFNDDGDDDVDRIVLHLIDGQRGDDDLREDRIILDPGAPVAIEPGNPTYIANVYLDLLDRLPDDGGFAFWVYQLESGMDREEVAGRILGSDEYREKSIESLYENLLHRSSDAAGFQFFFGLLQNGGSIRQVAAALLSSEEYYAQNGGANRSYLTAVYQDSLGRRLDDGGQRHWELALDSGANRLDVVDAVFASREFSEFTIGELYQTYLHRPAGAVELESLLQSLNSQRLTEELTLALIASDEYYGL